MADIESSIQISMTSGRASLITGGPRYAELYVDQLAELYESDFVDPPLQGTNFYSQERFKERLLEDYIASPNSEDKNDTDSSFKIVTFWINNHLVGFVTGASLPLGTQWWKDVRERLPEGFDEENGNRTFALFDIVVKKSLRGQGLGHQLHSKLLEGRGEERVTLMCSESRQPAYSIWRHWGYRKVGTVESVDHGTIWSALIRQLK